MKKIIFTVLLAISLNAYAGNAFWNGYIKFITTVSYQQGVECGYNYNGQTFYKVFLGATCPSSIDVY
jgi:hypothetical protein